MFGPRPALLDCGLVTPYDDINLVNIGSGNGLPPARHQAITWTNADLLTYCQVDP